MSAAPNPNGSPVDGQIPSDESLHDESLVKGDGEKEQAGGDTVIAAGVLPENKRTTAQIVIIMASLCVRILELERCEN